MPEDDRVGPRKVDQQNRVAIPPEVLDVLGIEAGDYVAFEVEQDGARLVKVRWVADE